jgi:hypothetical protein
MRNSSRQFYVELTMWEKTGSGRYTPTIGIVCPCALFIVIAKFSLIGNYLNGSVTSSDGERGILRRKTRLPTCWPFTISASIELLPKPLTTNRVPLQRPLCGSRLRSRITGQFFFILSILGGKPLGVIEFKKSSRYVLVVSSSTVPWLK